MKNATNITKYRRLSKVYDFFFGWKSLVKARRRAIELLGISPDDDVLLVGVGTGADLPFLPKCHTVTGLDISEDMLAIANAKIGDGNIKLLIMDAENLQLADKAYDQVILNLILSVVENPAKALNEAARVLRDDGKILVFDKFAQHSGRLSIIRRMLNAVTSFFGTDITRNMNDIMKGLPLHIVLEEKSLFHGNYRILILQRTPV